jgi:hypothetical protein
MEAELQVRHKIRCLEPVRSDSSCSHCINRTCMFHRGSLMQLVGREINLTAHVPFRRVRTINKRSSTLPGKPSSRARNVQPQQIHNSLCFATHYSVGVGNWSVKLCSGQVGLCDNKLYRREIEEKHGNHHDSPKHSPDFNSVPHTSLVLPPHQAAGSCV